jgi:hypothetical protein
MAEHLSEMTGSAGSFSTLTGVTAEVLTRYVDREERQPWPA